MQHIDRLAYRDKNGCNTISYQDAGDESETRRKEAKGREG